MEQSDHDIQVYERIARLETMVSEIKDNHLAHIEARLTWIFGLLITTLIGIVSMLLNLLLK